MYSKKSYICQAVKFSQNISSVYFVIAFSLLTEWVQMAPALFSKFIPNILPPAVESELQEYAAQDQKLQRELIQNGFTR